MMYLVHLDFCIDHLLLDGEAERHDTTQGSAAAACITVVASAADVLAVAASIQAAWVAAKTAFPDAAAAANESRRRLLSSQLHKPYQSTHLILKENGSITPITDKFFLCSVCYISTVRYSIARPLVKSALRPPPSAQAENEKSAL